MATTPQIALPIRAASPIALWHLLSLDAPTVATVWVWFIARTCHLCPPLASLAASAIAVWMLYVADRLLDVRKLDAEDSTATGELEARHLFHYHHRHAFMGGIAIAAVALAALSSGLDPAATRLYLIEGALLFAWFVILHGTRSTRRLPKEIAVGMFFSAAILIPTLALDPALRASLLPDAILFGALCSLNCLFIFAWEHGGPARSTARLAHATTRVAVAHLFAIAAALTLAGVVGVLLGGASTKPIAAACVLATLLLLALHCNRYRLSRTHLRAAADMALLTPMLLFPFLR